MDAQTDAHELQGPRRPTRFLSRIRDVVSTLETDKEERAKDDRSTCCHPKQDNVIKHKHERDALRDYYE